MTCIEVAREGTKSKAELRQPFQRPRRQGCTAERRLDDGCLHVSQTSKKHKRANNRKDCGLQLAYIGRLQRPGSKRRSTIRLAEHFRERRIRIEGGPPTQDDAGVSAHLNRMAGALNNGPYNMDSGLFVLTKAVPLACGARFSVSQRGIVIGPEWP